jgi:hypothetical protein
MTFSLGQSVFDLPDNICHRAAFPSETAQTVPKANDFSISRGIHGLHSCGRLVLARGPPNVNEKRTKGKPLEIAAALDRHH